MSAAASRHRSLPPALRGFWAWTVVCTLINVFVTAWYRHVLHPVPFPQSNPFFQRFSFQYDYFCYTERMKYFGTAQFFHVPGQTFSYPALLALAYKFFYTFGSPLGHRLYIATVIGAFTAAAWLFARALVRRGIAPLTSYLFSATVLATSYPLGLLVYLANMEGLVWIPLALGMWAMVGDRRMLAAALIGVAGAMKIFPLIYLGVFLARKQYKPFLFGIAVCIAVNVVSLAVLGPSIAVAYHGISEGLQAFQKDYVYHFKAPENSMDHSLYEVIKVPIAWAKRTYLLPKVSLVYLATAAVAGTTLFFTTLRRLPFLNLLLTLFTAAVLLPQSSHDYNLVQMYVPWALLAFFLLDNELDEITERGVRYVMACFVLLFTAQAWLIAHKIRFAGQFKALALVVLFGLALRYRFTSRSEHTLEGEAAL